jgi:nicotinate-nucleotide adenylyltransferase
LDGGYATQSFEQKKVLCLDDYHRLHMVHLATEDFPKIQPSDIEFKLPQPNYTVNTLAHLQEKYPKTRVFLNHGRRQFEVVAQMEKLRNYFSKTTIFMSILAFWNQ